MFKVIVIVGPLVIAILGGIPIAFAAALASIGYFVFTGQIDLLYVIVEQTFEGVNSFIFMAIPFFILCGDVMAKGEISKRLIVPIDYLVGRITGGLTYVTTLACMLFGAVSGSGPGTTAAIGKVMAPEMVKKGYDKSFISAVIGASGPLGILIPPSIVGVVYAAVTNVSVGTLFLALIGSGVLFGGIIMIVNYLICKKRGYGLPETKETFSIKKFVKYLIKAIPALFVPIIVLGGIFSGLFTPTEAAVVASVYAIVISLILRTLKLTEIFNLFKQVAILGGSLMLIVGTITAFKWVLAIEEIPLIIANSIASFSESKILFLIITNVVFFIAGMFEAGSANVLLLVPIMYPISQILGINPVFYGVIVVANQAIGMITPPFAITLFVSSRVCDVPFDDTAKEIIPYILCLIVGMILITFIEPISLYIPKLFGLIK